MLRHLLVLALTSVLVGVPPLGVAAVAETTSPQVEQIGSTTSSTGGTATNDDSAVVAGDALDAAQALFDGPPVRRGQRRTRGRRAVSRDGTVVLRDLVLRLGDLSSRAERRAAGRILQRPTHGGSSFGGEPKYTTAASAACTPTVCVHWVENDGNAPTGSDGDPNTVPSWVSTTLSTMDSAYAVETGRLGYRPPLSDATAADNGGDGRLDVYLAEIGDQDLFGYCVPDDPARSTSRTVYGYCVLDNDYSSDEFGTEHTSLENLQVTVAHELFHAVQFAYDWTEDLWLMEGTAAWMEDELYDGVDDNRRYLSFSPLAASDMPLDYVTAESRGYGAWIFWRFLSEWVRPGRAADPSVIRQVWEYAAGPRYSTSALGRALAARHLSFPVGLARFGMWNRDPRHFYSEGNAYRPPPLLARKTFTRTSLVAATRSVTGYHMGQAFVRYTPGTSLVGRWRLRVDVDMPDTYRGSRAQVVVHLQNGAISPYVVRLSRHGVGTRLVGFDRRTVRYVELGLIDASTRFRCGLDTYLSCSGVPLDDTVRSRFSARVIR